MSTPRIVVTAGPTIATHDIHSVIPHAQVVPPIAFGHALGYGLRGGDTLVIIDGLFMQNPSVRHKELLALLVDGVRVAGASSMGALRAAELHPFGMEGYGWVFESYRDGTLEADDEVGMVHGDGEDGYPVFVDALVNMRHTAAHAVGAGVLSQTLADRLIEIARGIPFTTRTWDRLLAAAGANDRRALARQLRTLRVDIKHADAMLALRSIDASPQPEPARPGPPPTIWGHRWRQRWAPATPTPTCDPDGSAAIVDVADGDVLALLSLCATDDWTYIPALEQFAAWHRRTTHPHERGDVRTLAARAVAEVPAPDPVQALESVVFTYLVACGTIDETGFPDEVSGEWLTEQERTSLGCDIVAAAARVAARTLFLPPALPAIDHFLTLIRSDARLHRWRELTASALARRDALARRMPQLNLNRPDANHLRALYSARWGVPADRIAQARRGLFTDAAFYSAATTFAVAAADGALPEFRVGTLGLPAPRADARQLGALRCPSH